MSITGIKVTADVHVDPSESRDEETVAVEAQLYKSRAGYASVVTRRFNEISKAMQDNQPRSELQDLLIKLDSAFWIFKSADSKHR